MNGLLHVSSSPHARSKVTTDKIMFAVLLALAPAACVGVWNFGLRALLLIAISMAVCPLTEYLYEKGMKKPVTIADGSALVTGLLLAMNMPVQAPLWIRYPRGVRLPGQQSWSYDPERKSKGSIFLQAPGS